MPMTGGFIDAARARRCRAAAACALVGAWLALSGTASAQDPAALGPELPPERYTVTRWNADDGLPHSQIHAINQDRDGFLWVSTWEGTARFDGIEFRVVDALNHPDGRRLASRLLWRDDDGSLLVGVDDVGLLRVSGKDDPQPACTAFPAIEAMRLARGRDGVHWLAARDGLYRLHPGGQCTRLDQGEALTRQDVLALLEHADGSLWAGNRRGLYRWHEGTLQALGNDIGLPQGEVRGLEQTPDGAIWIVGDLGIWRYHQGRLERLRDERAEGILQDRSGALWVSVTNSQLLRYRDGAWQRLDASDGIEGFASGAMFEGREGLVWFGTTHGLFRVADGPVWGIGRPQGLSNDYVRSLLQTGDGQAWIGHSGGLSRMRGTEVERVIPAPGVPPSSVLSMALAADGGIWAGTYNRGVLHVGSGDRPAVRSLAGDDSPLSTEQVRAVLEDPTGTLWIGTERGLVAWRDGHLDLRPLPDLPDLPVRALHQSDGGALWIGLFGGLARREPDGRLIVLRPELDYPARSILDFHADADGTLWLASDRGLLRQRDGAFELYGRDQGLSGSALFRILADDHDNLWVSGNDGVTRIPRGAFDAVDRGQAARLDVQMFSRDDGMPSRQANGGSAPAGWRMDDGKLWLATAAGVAVFNPGRVMRELRHDVPLVIDQVLLNGVDQPLAATHALPAGTRLAIRYAGISLRNPNGLRYRYRMHGFDHDWIDAGQARVAAYTNLPSGALRFEVQVARAPADWSRPASVALVDFEVAPPWWARPWVVVAAIAGLLLLFAGAHQWLGRSQRRRARRLEVEVAQRTEALRGKNRELEDASRQRELLLEQLAHQADHDPLTGLPNRRASDRELAAAIQQANHASTPLCVAIIDIDRFKYINDRYGHQTGDRVLARVAQQLQAALREASTFVGRTGGEEFLVVMRGATLADAVEVLERLRHDIAALRVAPEEDVALACTISVGVVERNDHEGPDALLQRADNGLYAAKRQGRDRVVAA
ncbi:MAG TPA: diguanylate cyclase [Luteimonas sp.]|nr:diguanylate cyclase [Luteimonas sp.]